MTTAPHQQQALAAVNAPSDDELQLLDAYWRTANYLAVGMIYLQSNPLLREPLRPEHIKPRLLGHWGSSPGQAFIWTHANRLIRKYDLDMIYMSGPGHGAPGARGPVYIDGSYSERERAHIERWAKQWEISAEELTEMEAEVSDEYADGFR